MKDTRDLKTLLELLLEEVKSNLTAGLCHTALELRCSKIINSHELTKIFKFIDNNRPKIFQRGFHITQIFDCYYWKEYSIKPRVKFLQHWIKKLS